MKAIELQKQRKAIVESQPRVMELYGTVPYGTLPYHIYRIQNGTSDRSSDRTSDRYGDRDIFSGVKRTQSHKATNQHNSQ